jgi:hypothetical protein
MIILMHFYLDRLVTSLSCMLVSCVAVPAATHFRRRRVWFPNFLASSLFCPVVAVTVIVVTHDHYTS